MSGKKIDRWKNRQPPKKLWWKPEFITEELIKACRDEKKGMIHAENIARKVSRRAFYYQDKRQAIQDTADYIVGYGYHLTLRDYKPDKGAKFETFLYHVLLKAACRSVSGFKKKSMHFAQNHVTLISRGNIVGQTQGVFVEGEEDIPIRCYSILHFNRFICSPLLMTNNGKSKQFMESNQHDIVKERCFTFDKKMTRETIDLLHKVRNISDAEFQTIKRRYLPVMYRKMTDAKLRSALSLLDVRIFKMAVTINCKKGYAKTMIQKILGIKRDFLRTRFMAILKRLDIPYESAVRWYKNHKIYKRKRERKIKKIDETHALSFE